MIDIKKRDLRMNTGSEYNRIVDGDMLPLEDGEMKVVIGIPTGNRKKQAVEVAKLWMKRGIDVCLMTWDVETYWAFEKAGLANDPQIKYMQTDNRESFAKNQNNMMRAQEWDVWICGSDDLYPGSQPDLKDRIELVASNSGDRLIWVGDGLFNQQPTHPIITRAMYEAEEGKIFDEEYIHNYVDTDLFARMLTANRVVKCFDIMFLHRHPLGNQTQSICDYVKEDEIYQIGQQSMPQDAIRYHKKWGGKKINTIKNVEVVEIDYEKAEA